MNSTLKTIARTTAVAAILCVAGAANAQYNNYIELSKPGWSTENPETHFYVQRGWMKSNWYDDLPLCTFSHPAVLSYSTAASATWSSALIAINAKEARKLPAGKNTLTVTCGGKSAPFVVDNTYPSLTKAVAHLDDSDLDAIQLTVTRPSAQVNANKPVTYWIAGIVPGHILGLDYNPMFFLVPKPGGGTEWRMMDSPDLGRVAFAKNQPGAEPSHELPVNFGATKAELAALQAHIMFGYQVGDGDLVVLDTTWNPAVPTAPKGKYNESTRLYLFESLNKVRAITGVGYVKQVDALDKTAQSHADYLVTNTKNPESLHLQIPGNPGFTGVNQVDRAATFGYISLVEESISISGNPFPHTWDLLAVPLHALGLLAPYQDVGIGTAGRSASVFNGGYKSPKQELPPDFVAIFPCNNIQVNVQGQGYETPTPHVLNGKQDFGFSTVALTRSRHKLKVDSWELRDAAGNLVPTVVMELGNEAAMIPWDTLPRIETNYTSVLKGRNNGVPFEKTCTFRTVAGDTVPVN